MRVSSGVPTGRAVPLVGPASGGSGMIADRMRELGIVLPPVFPPAGNYLGCVVDGDLVWVGGHGPEDGEHRVTGKVGACASQQTRRPSRKSVPEETLRRRQLQAQNCWPSR